MASIDVRKDTKTKISKIQFSDSMYGCAYYLDSNGGHAVTIQGACAVYIASKEDAQNLIKALEKAIELGWWKE